MQMIGASPTAARTNIATTTPPTATTPTTKTTPPPPTTTVIATILTNIMTMKTIKAKKIFTKGACLP